MSDHLFDSADDYHYDNSGYYGYVVFNGDERALNGLRHALGQGRQSHGLGWYRYGKSFRPANDGRMYDWYIRLHSGGHDKPPARAVNDFLRRFLKPPSPAPRPSPSRRQPSDPLARDFQQLQSDIAREKAAHQEAYGAQQRLATLLSNLQGIDARISDDLEQLRLDLQDIADTWRADNWSDLNLGSIIHALDSVNERLTRDLTRLQRDYSDIASAHADTMRAQDELAQVLERIKDHDRHISDDLARLQQDVQRLAERESQDSAADSHEVLLTHFDALGKRLVGRIDELERAVQAGTAAQAELEEMRARLEATEDAKEGAEQAQARAEAALDAKQTELAALQSETPGDQFWHERYNESEDQIRKLKKDNKSLEKDVRNLERNLKKTAEERDNFAKQFLEASKKIGEMEKSASTGLPEPNSIPVDRRMKVSDLENILEGAFPNLVFARDSMDTLHHEIQNYRPVFQRLSQIVNFPEYNGRNSLKGKSKWREDTIGKRWRIYFCKESMPGNKFVVYLGDKNHQNDDIAWLFDNPPETCL